MAPLTFVSSFAGVRPSAARNGRQTSTRRHSTPSCAMGDSVAPKITILDTKSDQTSKITIAWETVPSNESAAVAVTGNMGLFSALKSKTNRGTALPPAEKKSLPDGVSPVDFYFPKNVRNKAPAVSMCYNSEICVSMDEINPVVAGVSANSTDSIAFWKAKTHKYSAADLPPPLPDSDEPVSSADFEKYFPSKLRNMAPKIEIRAPKGDWDTTAFLILKNEYTGLNYAMASNITLPPSADESVKANAVVEKYFGKGKSYAPAISINENKPSVEFGLEEIPLPSSEAEQLNSKLKMKYSEV